jgi:hypothetical protein
VETDARAHFARVQALAKDQVASVAQLDDTTRGVAFLLTVVAVGPPESIEPPLNRLLGIVVGVSIMMVVSWALGAARPAPAAAATT